MKDWRIGIDVGGTNTDAVVLDNELNLVAAVKCPTTEDVMGGIRAAMASALAQVDGARERIGYAMLGTTHCTNAIVERKRLDRVAVIRLGAPATAAIKPMVDWPSDLREAISDRWYLVGGGHEFDGREIAPLDEAELERIAAEIEGACDSVAITSVFSPVDASHEKRAAEIVRARLGENFPVSISSEIGSVSLLERENATILNAALVTVAKTTSESFVSALAAEGIEHAEVYLCQNDGTLMSAAYAMRYPILTIACGPTNSIRGASFLTGLKDAVVVDVGGTTADLGALTHGFPRESLLAVEIGGVRTNFRMPDIISIGLGGGSIVRRHEDGSVTVGPDSVGYQVLTRALCFGGDVLTATDIAVASGAAEGVGDHPQGRRPRPRTGKRGFRRDGAHGRGVRRQDEDECGRYRRHPGRRRLYSYPRRAQRRQQGAQARELRRRERHRQRDFPGFGTDRAYLLARRDGSGRGVGHGERPC